MINAFFAERQACTEPSCDTFDAVNSPTVQVKPADVISWAVYSWERVMTVGPCACSFLGLFASDVMVLHGSVQFFELMLCFSVRHRG